jgi:competence protein ComEC
MRPLLALVLALVACGGAPRPVIDRDRPPQAAPVMRAHFIDVGQGDATLLEFPCGAALIDTGGELNDAFDGVAALEAYLDAFFARRADLDRTIDLLVVTHPHIDHTRGLPMVLEKYRVRSLVDDGLERSSGAAEAQLLHARAHERGVPHRDVRVEELGPEGGSDGIIDPIRCDDVDPEIRVLWGQLAVDPGWKETPWGTKPFDNENNHSVALRVDFGRASFLFTGDLEEEALDAFVGRYHRTGLLDVDVYKVGHHGSRNGTTEGLVRAMTPRVAVLSMGPALRRLDWTAWKYGHPNTRVVELLAAHLKDRRPGTEVRVGRRSMEFGNLVVERAIYGTGWDGTVVIEASARGRLTVNPPSVTPQRDAPAVVDVGPP